VHPFLKREQRRKRFWVAKKKWTEVAGEEGTAKPESGLKKGSTTHRGIVRSQSLPFESQAKCPGDVFNGVVEIRSNRKNGGNLNSPSDL